MAPPYSQAADTPLANFPALPNVDYVRGDAIPGAVALILNPELPSIKGKEPEGPSRLAILDTKSNSIRLKSNTLGRFMPYAFAAKIGAEERFYCIVGCNIVVMDSNLQMVDVIPTTLDRPYGLLVIP